VTRSLPATSSQKEEREAEERNRRGDSAALNDKTGAQRLTRKALNDKSTGCAAREPRIFPFLSVVPRDTGIPGGSVVHHFTSFVCKVCSLERHQVEVFKCKLGGRRDLPQAQVKTSGGLHCKPTQGYD